jgi:hypothetical protein
MLVMLLSRQCKNVIKKHNKHVILIRFQVFEHFIESRNFVNNILLYNATCICLLKSLQHIEV